MQSVSSSDTISERAGARPRPPLWRLVLLVLALAWAIPLAWNAYEQLDRVGERARTRLIEQHRLWEVDPNFRGKPEIWVRMAARLLSDRQVLQRVATKYGGASEEIELEYRRDLTMARAEVVVVALAWWALPLAVLYGGAVLVRRRTPAPPAKAEPASVSDPRYRPPDAK
jgi:hypothetical protein